MTKQGILTEGKAQYSCHPCPNYFRLPAFDSANIIFCLTEQAILMRRSIVLSLPFHKGSLLKVSNIECRQIPTLILFDPSLPYRHNQGRLIQGF
jgi:hypothetical protein